MTSLSKYNAGILGGVGLGVSKNELRCWNINGGGLVVGGGRKMRQASVGCKERKNRSRGGFGLTEGGEG